MADTLYWEMSLPEQRSKLPDTCVPAVASVVRELSTTPERKKVEIVAYANSPGSVSLGLARVSALAGELREAILRAGAKMRIRIDMSLLPAHDAEPGSPFVGRIVLRVVNRGP